MGVRRAVRPCRLSDDKAAGEEDAEVCVLVLYAPQGKYSVTAHGYHYTTPQDLEDSEAQKYELEYFLCYELCSALFTLNFKNFSKFYVTLNRKRIKYR